MHITEIATDRLRVLALTPEALRAYLEAPASLERACGHRITRDGLDGPLRQAIEIKLQKMEAAPVGEHPWLTYWLIVPKNEPFGAGFAGFKGLDLEIGETEIGYGIDPRMRGKGYMTEAVRGLIAWAFTDPRCRAIVAPGTLRGNLASHRVLEKSGMLRVGEAEDTIDWRIDKPAT